MQTSLTAPCLPHDSDHCKAEMPAKLYGDSRAPAMPLSFYELLHQIYQVDMSHRIVFVGNPPYQRDSGDSSAVGIYNLFVDHALVHGEEGLFVIPARWYATGRGMDDFRASLLTGGKVKQIIDFPNSRSVFTTVDIASGICFLHVSNAHNGNCTLIDGDGNHHDTDLSKFDILVREPKALSIINKVVAQHEIFLSQTVTPQNAFGLILITSFRNFAPVPSASTYGCETKDGIKQVEAEFVTRRHDIIDKWKVITSKAGPASGRADKHGRRTVLSITKVLPPKHVCLQTYIIVATFDNQKDAENCVAYLALKLPRYLIAQRAISQDLPPQAWSWAPRMDFTRIWTDQELYDHFDLTADERSHIEATIKSIR
jgi:site-specific DNA-methyltransferase (adenine-specific)